MISRCREKPPCHNQNSTKPLYGQYKAHVRSVQSPCTNCTKPLYEIRTFHTIILFHIYDIYMNICFEFIQIAIGTRTALSRPMTDKDWQRCFVFCKRQTLLGIGFTAVERLHEKGVSCPSNLLKQWYVYALQTENINRKMNAQCRELSSRIESAGLLCCILKGQSHQMVYPEHLKARRSPGDIDVWCHCPKEGVLLTDAKSQGEKRYYGHKAIREYVRRQARLIGVNDNLKTYYHHIEAPEIDKTHVEMHYRPSFMYSAVRNRRQQRYFSLHAEECMRNKTALGFSMLTPSVNVVYQMCHLFAHLMEMGLGLRQFIDYYFTLIQWHDYCRTGTDVDNDVMDVLRSLGLTRFAGAVMYILREVLAMPTHYYICEPDETEGPKVLADIIRGGNFGQYDDRGREMRNGETVAHSIWKLGHVMRFVARYPEESLCEPFFRLYHFFWRQVHHKS